LKEFSEQLNPADLKFSSMDRNSNIIGQNYINRLNMADSNGYHSDEYDQGLREGQAKYKTKSTADKAISYTSPRQDHQNPLF
jgi:hypothetical protein